MGYLKKGERVCLERWLKIVKLPTYNKTGIGQKGRGAQLRRQFVTQMQNLKGENQILRELKGGARGDAAGRNFIHNQGDIPKVPKLYQTISY